MESKLTAIRTNKDLTMAEFIYYYNVKKPKDYELNIN